MIDRIYSYIFNRRPGFPLLVEWQLGWEPQHVVKVFLVLVFIRGRRSRSTLKERTPVFVRSGCEAAYCTKEILNSNS